MPLPPNFATPDASPSITTASRSGKMLNKAFAPACKSNNTMVPHWNSLPASPPLPEHPLPRTGTGSGKLVRNSFLLLNT